MRAAFSEVLVQAAQRDPRVVLLTGDHGYALFDDFRQRCGGQYINAGVAEQNMVGVAAGLAKAGFRPVVYGLSAFVPVRVLEQIKIDVCYEQLPVVFVGDGAGLVYSTLGTSHQSFEDIACLRAVPHIQILSPGDAFEMTACMTAALAQSGPVYVRMGKADLGHIHSSVPALPSGQLLPVRTGTHPINLVATGSILTMAYALATEIDATVWSSPWIKPLDAVQLRLIAQHCEGFVTLEEHSVCGGLGSAVVEALAEYGCPPVLRVGVGDRFSLTCGGYAHAMHEHGLDINTVRHRIATFSSQVSHLQ